jgi:glycosyltransferase involved in cell wall biosynthesis
MPTITRPINVNVHLYYGADPRQYRKGEGFGCLYGYHLAEAQSNYQMTYSHDAAEGKFRRTLRRGLKAVIGFDFLHAWHNRREILAADVAWTHTEFEYLAIALLLRLSKGEKKPLLLAQSVWLLDKWPSLSRPRKALYRWLLSQADHLTVHSEVNRRLCEKYFGRPAQMVYYGIDTKDFPVIRRTEWQPHTPIRLAAIGNDRDRDWGTLVEAFAHDPRFQLRLATRRKVKVEGVENVVVKPVHGMAAQRELYEWADMIIVPLHENKHVSGITVIFEGVTCAKPVVATNVGGLTGYFSSEEITYVPAADPLALKQAALDLANNPKAALAKTMRATRRFLESDYTTNSFARQHVEITEQMLSTATRS